MNTFLLTRPDTPEEEPVQPPPNPFIPSARRTSPPGPCLNPASQRLCSDHMAPLKCPLSGAPPLHSALVEGWGRPSEQQQMVSAG
ncbi:unnamed protein product [Lota lota]